MMIIERDELKIDKVDCIEELGYFLLSISGGIHTLSSRGNSEKRHDSQEKLTDFQSPMASSSRGTGSEDNDSDLDNQSHEDEIDNDDEQINKDEEQKKQLIVRKKK